VHGVSERRACHLVNQPRGTQRYRPTQRDDEDALTQAIIGLASQYGRYGYRRITALLQRAERANQVWSYDFVSTFTHDGRTVRMLNLIDEFTRECLAIRPRRRLNSLNVIEVLADAMIQHGIPEHIRSDNGPEFVAKNLRKWLHRTGAKTLYIEPGSPWENGYCESFNSKLRDQFLNGEIFYSLKEVQVLAERWRVHYNTLRPHSSLNYRPPAPEAWLSENKTGCGEVENAPCFPLPHTPDCGYRTNSITALH
jgi:putative transposase